MRKKVGGGCLTSLRGPPGLFLVQSAPSRTKRLLLSSPSPHLFFFSKRATCGRVRRSPGHQKDNVGASLRSRRSRLTRVTREVPTSAFAAVPALNERRVFSERPRRRREKREEKTTRHSVATLRCPIACHPTRRSAPNFPKTREHATLLSFEYRDARFKNKAHARTRSKNGSRQVHHQPLRRQPRRRRLQQHELGRGNRRAPHGGEHSRTGENATKRHPFPKK